VEFFNVKLVVHLVATGL